VEYVNCNVCDIDNTEFLFSKKDKFRISDADFNIVRCRNCGLLYINPRPTEEEIVKFYPDTYSWKETLKADSYFTQVIRRLEKIYRYHLLNYEVNKVLRHTELKSGKVLDIGCGTGDRLEVFRRRGFDVYGVEVSSSARYAREHLNLNVVEGNLFKAHYPDNFFDIATMYNVLEHLHRPKEMLQEVNRIVKKDGFLVIQVPNTDSLQFKRYGKRWSAFDVPRDLFYFNPQILSGLLKKTGFEVIKIDHMSSFWHPPTIVITLFPELDPQKSWLGEKNKKSTVLERLLWIFWTIALSFFASFEGLINKAAIVTVYCERKS